MSQKASITTSKAARVDNRFSSKKGFAEGVQDFLLLCKRGNIVEATRALYYLPQNYKLMVLSEGRQMSENDMAWVENAFLKNRIHFTYTEATEKKGPPYSVAHAIISDKTDAEEIQSSEAPYVVVSATAGAGITVSSTHGLMVQQGNPEALASAILHLARQN